MPRKAFLADLELIQRPGGVARCISDVHRGDDDGSFVFTFMPPGFGVNGIGITGMVPELDDYPASHQTYLYTNSPDAPTAATTVLAKFAPEDSKTLPDLLSAVASALTKAMGQNTSNSFLSGDSYDDTEMDEEYNNSDDGFLDDNEDDDEESEGEGEGEGEDEDDVSVGGWEEDYRATTGDIDGEGDSQMNDFSQDTQYTENSRKLKAALRRDLRLAKNAGFKVGVLGDHKGGMDLYVSIGIRVSKLGISDEAIDAWKLDRQKYLILLTHYSSFYQTLEKLTGEGGGYHVKKSVEMCVGTATRYKPTFLEAIGAFSKISSMENTQHLIGVEGGNLDTGVTEDKSNEDGFHGVFISRPLNELLNSRLIQLLRYRVQLGFGWDGAESYYIDNQGRESSSIGQVADKYYAHQEPKRALASIVTGDALASNSSFGDASFPLLAMQFTLRHLVRCTEFCLVCHTKVQNDFEALKPYVCSSPLCLYQYMSLGFGPSIEYEIVSQPTVVDLLVSFCYVSAKADKMFDFPIGMNLTVPGTSLKSFRANYHRLRHELLFDDAPDMVRPPLKVGDWITISIGTASPGSNDYLHARVTETDYYPTIRLAPPVGAHAAPANNLPSAQNGYSTNPTTPSTALHNTVDSLPEIITITFSLYDVNFDSLNDIPKRESLVAVLDTLPSVLEMRTWLQRNTKVGEEASLMMWKNRISPAALGVLRWIIASNRSCIVPVDHKLDPAGFITTGFGSKKGGEQRVWGMGDWLQFRFAMGAPDKEQRFVEAVQSAQRRLNLIYPSLFAFHGSPLANWHSIIREGLHFKQTLHGRAFGHGCYHSLDLSTSMGYSSSSGFNNSSLSPTWPQSSLNIKAALSLNEIVNAPDEFVSKSPHLVVSQLDWIQTRYLFIQVVDMKAESQAMDSPKPAPVHPQDDTYTPRGLDGKLVIPATVSSYRTRSSAPTAVPAPLPTPVLSPTGRVTKSSRQSKKMKGSLSQKLSYILPTLGSSSNTPIILDDDFPDDASIVTDNSDLLALLSDDEGPISPPDNIMLYGTDGPSSSRVPKAGAFTPGSLDISDLPMLPLPSYATGGASKRIQSDLKSIVKLQQAQRVEELGWYVDTTLTDNIYQWIVELHSFPEDLPLVKDMKEKNIQSIILEIRFGSQYPMSPPFIRVIKPRFMGFAQGGGGHVTVGGALCMELLTNSGWSAVSSLESVLLQVRMAIGEESPPARLAPGPVQCYSPSEAKEAYLRACRAHGWAVPADFSSIV